MKIVITKKCFVDNVLREAGEIIDVKDAAAYEGVANALEEVKPEPEAKPIKPISKPIKKGTKK